MLLLDGTKLQVPYIHGNVQNHGRWISGQVKTGETTLLKVIDEYNYETFTKKLI